MYMRRPGHHLVAKFMMVRRALLFLFAMAMISKVRGQESGTASEPLITCTSATIEVHTAEETNVTMGITVSSEVVASGGEGDLTFSPDLGESILVNDTAPTHAEHVVTDTPGNSITCRTTLSIFADTAADDDGDSTVTDDSSSSDSSGSTSLIVLAAMLAALVLGNLLCASWFLKCKPQKPRAEPPTRRGPDGDAELGMVKRELEAEHNRRVKAEALVQRAKGGGIRPGEFPSVRDVDRHVEQLADDALAWSEKACAVGGSHPALPATVQGVLTFTFVVCREEVERHLEERLQNLSAFLGNEEPVLLSGGDSMNLDTQYVLYECLCRNFTSIVPTDPEDMEELASAVQRRCGGSADRALVNRVIFGENAWPSFEALMKHYIRVFVEMALQKPRMDFGDSLGNKMVFDPRIHRDWSPSFKAPVGQQCSIVFPALRPVRGRPTSNAKIGVVRIPAR